MSSRCGVLPGLALLLCLSTVGRADDDQTPEMANLEKAKDALHHAQWQKADALLRPYLASHEADGAAHYLLAYALFREDDPADSLAEYTHAAHLQSPNAEQLRWVALDYVLLRDYKDADTWMSRSVNWNPQDGESWYDLGRIQYEENLFSKAEASFLNSLRLVPRSVKAENNLALTYEGMNRPDDALTAYRRAIEWQKDEPRPSEQPLLNLGSLLTERGQLDEALPLLQQAAEIAPDASSVHAALGKLYSHKNDLTAAQKEFVRAIALDPKLASLHFQLGVVYRRQGDSNDAKAEFDRAAQLDATHSSNDLIH